MTVVINHILLKKMYAKVPGVKWCFRRYYEDVKKCKFFDKYLRRISFIVVQNINTFHATGLFRYPLKTSENLWFWFSDVFREYRKRPVA